VQVKLFLTKFDIALLPSDRGRTGRSNFLLSHTQQKNPKWECCSLRAWSFYFASSESRSRCFHLTLWLWLLKLPSPILSEKMRKDECCSIHARSPNDVPLCRSESWLYYFYLVYKASKAGSFFLHFILALFYWIICYNSQWPPKLHLSPRPRHPGCQKRLGVYQFFLPAFLPVMFMFAQFVSTKTKDSVQVCISHLLH